MMPCPISENVSRTRTSPFVAMDSHAFSSSAAAGPSATLPGRGKPQLGTENASTSPPPPASDAARNLRRDHRPSVIGPIRPQCLGGGVDA